MAYRSHRKYQRNGHNKKIGTMKLPFCEFNPHEKPAPVIKNDNIIVTSIDPGIVNCGVYVCCYNLKEKTHKSLFLARLTFNQSENYYIESMKQFERLEKENGFFSASHYIVIESQMTISYDNTRLCQHLITYFMHTMKNKGSLPLVIEITSQAKTRLLGCPKKLTKYQYKKWAAEKAVELLEDRGEECEEKYVQSIMTNSKKDDKSDAICQYYAWIKIMEGEGMKPTLPTKEE